MSADVLARLEECASEKRRARRHSVSLCADVRLPDGTWLCAQSTDISETGIGLLSPYAVSVDQDCQICIKLRACGADHKLALTGRVCYCIRQGNDHRIGMHFVGLDADSYTLLCTLLATGK